MKEQKDFYQTLYTSKIKKEESKTNITKNCTDDHTLPHLSEIDKSMCEEPICLDECSKALKLLPNNKSLWSDGFTTNLYNFFWKDLKDPLFQSFQASFESKKLTSFQRMGILNLLLKQIKILDLWQTGDQ